MTTLRILTLVVLAIGLCIVEATDCPSFECFNGGVCANSTANFSDHVAANGLVLEMHIETSRHGMHCECPSGFTGLFCNKNKQNDQNKQTKVASEMTKQILMGLLS